MARPLRIEFSGALYHVTSRGNARAPIFLEDADRLRFLDVVAEVVERYRWTCHCYCLMTNHYHLVVDTPEANLSAGMRLLNGVYTQGFNRRHGRVGHVFQGRFAGILVERLSHLLELARYVVLNPVRAGLVAPAEDYRWSSLRATLGLESAPRWLAVSGLLEPFGSRSRYREFVREGIGRASPWRELRGSVLGSETFVRSVGPYIQARTDEPEIPRRERLASRQGLDGLLPETAAANKLVRNRLIREANRAHGYSLAEIARYLRLQYSTVSRIAATGTSVRKMR